MTDPAITVATILEAALASRTADAPTDLIEPPVRPDRQANCHSGGGVERHAKRGSETEHERVDKAVGKPWRLGETSKLISVNKRINRRKQ